MRALVTGGAGFIGSTLVDALIGAGHEVTVVDDLSRGRREQVHRDARFVQLDVGSPELERTCLQHQPEVIFHQAAQIDVRESVRDPMFDATSNVLGTIGVLRSAVACGARRVVFAGSGGAMYGDTDELPTPEEHPAEPQSPYGAAKVAGEVYGRTFARMHGIDFIALRYANVYGPRQDPHGEAGVVGIFIQRLLAGEVAIINGDGRQTRDYVYVDDVVAANLRAAAHPGSEACNVGTATETTVNQLYRLISEATGIDTPAQHGDAKPGEQRRSCLAFERVERTLGWRPSVTLEDGLRRTVESFRALG